VQFVDACDRLDVMSIDSNSATFVDACDRLDVTSIGSNSAILVFFHVLCIVPRFGPCVICGSNLPMAGLCNSR
jgi:hypothetical protein